MSAVSQGAPVTGPIRSTVPARLDRRAWSRFLLGNALTALSPNFAVFALTRILAGTGIGGEYAASNSAIDELIPASHRGHTDVAVNGTCWLGAMIGPAANLAFLNDELFVVDGGWRLGLLIGPVIGVPFWPLWRKIPESPRRLLTHGYVQAAERIVGDIERELQDGGIQLEPVGEHKTIEIVPRGLVSYRELARLLVRGHRRPSVVGFLLMVTQSFLYNAIFFTYALVFASFYDIRGGGLLPVPLRPGQPPRSVAARPLQRRAGPRAGLHRVRRRRCAHGGRWGGEVPLGRRCPEAFPGVGVSAAVGGRTGRGGGVCQRPHRRPVVARAASGASGTAVTAEEGGNRT